MKNIWLRFKAHCAPDKDEMHAILDGRYASFEDCEKAVRWAGFRLRWPVLSWLCMVAAAVACVVAAAFCPKPPRWLRPPR